MEKICQIYQDRSTMVIHIFQCLIFVAAALLFMNYADVFSMDCSMRGEFRHCCFTNPIIYSVIGKGLLTYFGLSMLVFICYFLKPYCLFYMNENGFWARDYGFVEWKSVSKLYLDNVSCKKVICFELKESDNLKIPFVLRIFRKIKKIFHDSGFVVDFSGKENMVEEVFKVMTSYYEN